MKKTNHILESIEEQKMQALMLMEGAGFGITQSVSVTIDPQLPFMGYTTQQYGKPIIVVSENAAKSGMALSLLIHELSHIYRSQSSHPSHDYQLLTAITGWVTQGKIVHEYQGQIIQNIINHLQDLYADDISFAIFKSHTPQQDLTDFFLTWIHEPSIATDPTQRSWENAGNFLSTAFAVANLERHKIADTDGKVAHAVAKFLDTSTDDQKAKFHFFKEFMIRLPENITEKEFEKLLIAYLSEFLKLTKRT